MSRQVPHSTNLPPFSPLGSLHPPVLTAFQRMTALLSDATATTSLHTLEPHSLHFSYTMSQSKDKQIEVTQPSYNDNYNRCIRNARELQHPGQFLFVDKLPLTSSAAYYMGTESFNKLL